MEIRVSEKDKNRVEIELVAEDHTLCNALRNELCKDNDVKAAAYKIEHPLASNPIILVETKKGNPRKTITKAADSLKKTIKEFRDSLKTLK